MGEWEMGEPTYAPSEFPSLEHFFQRPGVQHPLRPPFQLLQIGLGQSRNHPLRQIAESTDQLALQHPLFPLLAALLQPQVIVRMLD